ncbi:hypothetical protein ZWY2020_046741 [Hordeum vulgare]|nr:hypothetical protein ZWY2020_046741 [Hordeum vulgare]
MSATAGTRRRWRNAWRRCGGSWAEAALRGGRRRPHRHAPRPLRRRLSRPPRVEIPVHHPRWTLETLYMLSLKTCILRAREHLDEKENEESMPTNRQPDSRFLFEGHLTVGQEPPPPAWLVAQNLTRELNILAEPSGDQNGNNTRTELRPEEMTPAIMNFLNTLSGDADLESALEASLQGIAPQPKVPPASKEVVANLPVVTVTEEVIARLGSETECAVCRENLVVDDKMQELPCKHLFHPPCLKPWLLTGLDGHPGMRTTHADLRPRAETDDHARAEGRGERRRKTGRAANAVRGGEFMYI